MFINANIHNKAFEATLNKQQVRLLYARKGEVRELAQRFYYCPKCGGKLIYRPQKGISRLTCVDCAYIFYENPVVGVAAIVLDNQGRVLLGRRAASYRGFWCVPCGYVEYGEDVYAAAVREFKEETNLDIVIEDVFTVQSNFHNREAYTVGIWFLARVVGGTPRAGDDLEEIAFFDLQNLPPLAFPTDQKVLGMLAHKLRNQSQDNCREI